MEKEDQIICRVFFLHSTHINPYCAITFLYVENSVTKRIDEEHALKERVFDRKEAVDN